MLLGSGSQKGLETPMFSELVIVPVFALLKGLFWTGLLFLLYRHLHQSGALTMDALQDPAPDPVECMEEDIADKVGPGCRSEGGPPTGNTASSQGAWVLPCQAARDVGLAEGWWWCHQG